MRWFWLLCLTAAAVSDIKERVVSCKVLAVCGGAGILYALSTGMAGHIWGLPAGLGLLLMSRATRGAIGMGDGWFLAASAWYLSAEEIWFLLAGSLSLSWCWSAGIILCGIWHGRNTKSVTLPFLACMWPMGAWLVVSGEGVQWLSVFS